MEGPLVIRLGGPRGLILERGGQIIDVRSGADPEAIRALTRGPAVRAFRLALGNYERQLANDPSTLHDTLSPFAYSALLTAAFVGEMAGDPRHRADAGSDPPADRGEAPACRVGQVRLRHRLRAGAAGQ